MLNELDLATQLFLRARVQELQAATAELRHIRDRFGEIYNYYFPQTLGGWLRRMVGLSHQPDFTRFVSELDLIRSQTLSTIEDAKTAYHKIAKSPAPLFLKEWSELAYKQVYYDGSAMLIF